MTSEAKVLIDAYRAGFLACWSSEFGPLTDDAWASAARAFPYPPEPPEPPELPVYTDAEGDQWRVRDGVVEWRCGQEGEWMDYGRGWFTPDFIRGLHALLPPSAEEAPR